MELRVWQRKGAVYPGYEELELIGVEGGLSVRRFVARLIRCGGHLPRSEDAAMVRSLG